MLSSASLRTFVLLCVVAGIDRADQQLLPSVYLEVCGEFHVGPSALGLVTFCCGLAQSLVAAFAGPLGSRMDRIQLIAVGTVWWGVSSILVGASTTLSALLVARTLNGLGLGLVMPLVFAVVADLIPEAHHGRFFGVVSFAGMAGGAGGGLFATELAASRAALGIPGLPGWRAAFYIVGILSCVLGVLVGLLAYEPRTRASTLEAAPLSRRAVWAAAWTVLRVPTFALILAQGAVGVAPWCARGKALTPSPTSQSSDAALTLVRPF